MEKIKLGIVGFGFMGHCDADMMASFDEIDLTAVADTNPEQLKDAPEGVGTYGSRHQCSHDLYTESKPSGNGKKSGRGQKTRYLREACSNVSERI